MKRGLVAAVLLAAAFIGASGSVEAGGGQGQAVQHYIAHAAPGSVQVALVCRQNLVTGGKKRAGSVHPAPGFLSRMPGHII